MKWICNEDLEDFEQDKKIEDWLRNEKPREVRNFKFTFISRNRTARNTRVRASISLDQKISEDGPATFADIIVGSDGRDYIDRIDGTEDEISALEIIKLTLIGLGFNQKEQKWLIKILQL